MSLLPPIDPLLLLDDPAALAALLPGPTAAEDLAPPREGAPASVAAPGGASPDPAPGGAPPDPAFALVPEDAFPTIAELDALLAAHGGPPPGPDAALRAELAALLGLDPALAADEAAFAAALAALEPPDEAPLPDAGLSDGWPSQPDQAGTMREDWPLG